MRLHKVWFWRQVNFCRDFDYEKKKSTAKHFAFHSFTLNWEMYEFHFPTLIFATQSQWNCAHKHYRIAFNRTILFFLHFTCKSTLTQRHWHAMWMEETSQFMSGHLFSVKQKKNILFSLLYTHSLRHMLWYFGFSLSFGCSTSTNRQIHSVHFYHTNSIENILNDNCWSKLNRTKDNE